MNPNDAPDTGSRASPQEEPANPYAPPRHSTQSQSPPGNKWWYLSMLSPLLLVLGILGVFLALVWIARCASEFSRASQENRSRPESSAGLTFVAMLLMNMGIAAGVLGVACGAPGIR